MDCADQAPCRRDAPLKVDSMGQLIRRLAAKAGLPVHEWAYRLRAAGLEATIDGQRS